MNTAQPKNDISIDVRAGVAIVTQRQPRGHVRDTDYPGSASKASGSKRGYVTAWSRKSRKRILVKAASLRNAGNGLFITLTYPDSVASRSDFNSSMIKGHLELVRKWLLNRYPGAGAMWRVEVVARKSGVLKGRPVPHFHIILISPAKIRLDTIRRQLRKHWYKVAHYEDIHRGKAGVDVQYIHSRQHAMYYVSKYVAKNVDDEGDQPAFIVGRHWGTFGNWDTEAYYNAPLSYRQFVEFRRLMVRWLKSKMSKYAKRLARLAENVGFTIFGVGDESRSGNFVYRALQHALKLSLDPPTPPYDPLRPPTTVA